ncbi:MAG: hypothetical protein ACRCS9_07015 [Hyphomicrobium sp.]
MSRSEASFGQLVRYIGEGCQDTTFNLYRNLFVTDEAGLIAAFEKNGKLLKARKNGITMHHEIISITRARGTPLDRQKQALFEIASRYASERAPQCLIYGALHEDKENNLHYHLMISVNRKDEAKRHRLPKADFIALQRRLEAHVLADYPELQQAVAINKKAERKKTQAAQELERRTGALPERDQLAQGLKSLFKIAQSEEQFRSLLRQAGFTIYVRGKHVGFKHEASGKRYRVQTLGLTAEFVAMTRRIEAAAQNRRSQSSQQTPV